MTAAAALLAALLAASTSTSNVPTPAQAPAAGTAGSTTAVTGPVTETTLTVTLHGHPQSLRVMGRAATPAQVAIVSSGDGGWMHLAPHVADLLAHRGWLVVGLDARAYISTQKGTQTLTPADIADDYALLLRQPVFAGTRPVLIGISEGAGLSVVAASSPAVQARVRGVAVLGLGERNELAWHWRDGFIYLTKGVPDEPLFYASAFVGHVAPLPLAWLRSSRDEFVPTAESDRLIGLAHEPIRSWTIDAGDHSFSANRPAFDVRLTEALDWMATTHDTVPRATDAGREASR